MSVILLLLPIISIAVFFLITCAMVVKELLIERKEWNDGKCLDCGTELKFDSVVPSGGRLYKCPHCKRFVWLLFFNEK